MAAEKVTLILSPLSILPAVPAGAVLLLVIDSVLTLVVVIACVGVTVVVAAELSQLFSLPLTDTEYVVPASNPVSAQDSALANALQDWVVWFVAVAVAVYVAADCHEPGSDQLTVTPDEVTPETAPSDGVDSASVGDEIDVDDVEDHTANATPEQSVSVTAANMPTTTAVRDFIKRSITRSR